MECEALITARRMILRNPSIATSFEVQLPKLKKGASVCGRSTLPPLSFSIRPNLCTEHSESLADRCHFPAMVICPPEGK